MGIFNEIEITQFLSYWSFSTALQLLMVLLSSSLLLQRHKVTPGINDPTYSLKAWVIRRIGPQPAQWHNVSVTHVVLNSLKKKGHDPPNKVIHNAVSERVALEMPHQSSSHLAYEIGSYHGLITHKVVRGWSCSANLAKLHQPSAICKPIQMLWQPMDPTQH